MDRNWLAIAVVAIGAQGAASCDDLMKLDRQVAHCSKALGHLVRSPRTLKEHDIEVGHLGDETRKWVAIDYEAADAFGSIVRRRITCEYQEDAGAVMARAISIHGQELPKEDLAKVNGQITLAGF